MKIAVFSLAFCLLLVWVPSEIESQQTVCETVEFPKEKGFIKCFLDKIFSDDKSCKQKIKQRVCVTLPTTTTTPTTSTTTTPPPPTTTTKPTTTASTTTTDPTIDMDCSVDTFFPDIKDPTQYYQCQGSIPTLKKCPTTRNPVDGTVLSLVWDHHTTSCMITPKADVTCLQPNGRQPDPSYCNMYIECQNGVMSRIRCQAGFGYHVERRDCIPNPTCNIL